MAGKKEFKPVSKDAVSMDPTFEKWAYLSIGAKLCNDRDPAWLLAPEDLRLSESKISRALMREFQGLNAEFFIELGNHMKRLKEHGPGAEYEPVKALLAEAYTFYGGFAFAESDSSTWIKKPTYTEVISSARTNDKEGLLSGKSDNALRKALREIGISVEEGKIASAQGVNLKTSIEGSSSDS